MHRLRPDPKRQTRCPICQLTWEHYSMVNCLRCRRLVCFSDCHDINDMKMAGNEPMWLCCECFHIIAGYDWTPENQ